MLGFRHHHLIRALVQGIVFLITFVDKESHLIVATPTSWSSWRLIGLDFFKTLLTFFVGYLLLFLMSLFIFFKCIELQSCTLLVLIMKDGLWRRLTFRLIRKQLKFILFTNCMLQNVLLILPLLS